MTLPELNVPALLRGSGLHPKKSLGQNFLTDSSALRRIIEVSAVGEHDLVLEIGSGVGNLTRYLCAVAKQVVAVELDGRLIPILEGVLASSNNVLIIHGDILDLNPSTLIRESGYLVIANIPYYITSAILRHLLESEKPPSQMTLTLQREVAQRLCAEPGDHSILSLSVQVYGTPKIRGRIPARAFYPAPKVDSAIVQIELFQNPLIPTEYIDDFFRLVKAGFSQKRKMLTNALSAGMNWSKEHTQSLLTESQIDPRRRAETLSLEEWKNIVINIVK